MSSCHIESPKTITGFLGREEHLYDYFQFVPGWVYDVVTSRESLRAGGPDSADRNMNTIIAKPHLFEGLPPKNYELETNDKYRYWPLLRGMYEVPAKGDPVLLCTISGVNYYLGPINTENNSLNFNADVQYKREPNLDPDKNPIATNNTGTHGESLNFQKTDHKRLGKPYNINLDLKPDNGEGSPSDWAFREIHGDMFLDGRHGNSIRIGSRKINPYIFMSNSRNTEHTHESLTDGSLISMTSNGTLQQHFGKNVYEGHDPLIHPPMTQKQIDDGETLETLYPQFYPKKYKLTKNAFHTSSDLGAFDKRSINVLWKHFNKSIKPENISLDTWTYGYYKEDQILLNSDRITINTKSDSLFLSAAIDMYMGASRNIGIVSEEDVVVEARNIYLGHEARKYYETGHEKEGQLKGQPIVLGNELMGVLQELLDALTKACGLVQGVAVPLTDQTGIQNSFSELIKPIQIKLDSIISNKHFIEPNE